MEVDIALSRRPKLCPNCPSPIALLSNIITSINIRSPDHSEVVKKTKAITLVALGCPRAGKKSTPGPISPPFLPTSALHKMANKSNKSRTSDLLDLLFSKALICLFDLLIKQSNQIKSAKSLDCCQLCLCPCLTVPLLERDTRRGRRKAQERVKIDNGKAKIDSE